jgi:hypothetical protein
VKKIITALFLTAFLLTGFAAIGQTQTISLPVSKQTPTIDGVSASSEYSTVAELDKMTLGLSRTADTLYVAVSGTTTGWVAVGFGSSKMDGSLIFIGFVGSDGKATMKIQKGAGHSHGDVQSDALIQFAAKEDKGVTTLELALKASSVIAKGATDLPMIYAMGGADSFSSMMSFRGSVPVKLQ